MLASAIVLLYAVLRERFSQVRKKFEELGPFGYMAGGIAVAATTAAPEIIVDTLISGNVIPDGIWQAGAAAGALLALTGVTDFTSGNRAPRLEATPQESHVQ